jgi:hypothetical protein
MSDPRRPDGQFHRFTSPTRRGPWRDNVYAACVDAVRAGFGSVDEYLPEPDMPPVIYLHPLAEVETMPAELQAAAA